MLAEQNPRQALPDKEGSTAGYLVIGRRVNEVFYIEPSTSDEIQIAILQILRNNKVSFRIFSQKPNKIVRSEAEVMETPVLKAGSLNLKRKPNQAFIINPQSQNPIIIKLLEIDRNTARIGIYDTIKRKVLREELLKAPPNSPPFLHR